MPRVAGKDIPNDKKLPYSLAYIKGIGIHLGRLICQELKVDENRRAGELTEEQVSKINSIIERGYLMDGEIRREFLVEGQLQLKMSRDIARLQAINCYRGIRHKRKLPVRGQNTQSNARTRKGPRKTVAGKKGVKDMR
jgi:small subunit ribosomal protein S13